MKKKLLAGLVSAMMILLQAAAASPAAPLTCREIVEQVVVPLAVANDPEVGINHSFSADELSEIVRVLHENGITPEENSLLMQMYISGYGLYEDSVIMGICRCAMEEREGLPALEDQYWSEEQLIRIGALDEHRDLLPGPDNLSYEAAKAFALAAIRDAWGQDLPLEDRSCWKLNCQFALEDHGEPRWYFSLRPLDLYHGLYMADFADSDPEGTVSLDALIPDWSEPYSGEDLLLHFCQVFSTSQNQWTQAVWQELHELMQQAELDPGDLRYAELKGYQLTAYPEPGPWDLSREEAVRIARSALQKDRAALDSAVFTEYEGKRFWLVTLMISPPMEGPAEKEYGTWVITVDGRTGNIRSVREAFDEAAYVPEGAYKKARESAAEDTTDYIGIAAEAVKAQFPGLDPLDETVYTASVSGLYRHEVRFMPKSIQHGMITVTVMQDGIVGEIDADPGEPDGDNLFRRYWAVYGYFGNWDQSLWVQLGRDISDLEAESIDGKVLKAANFPEESSVAIPHEQAWELGMKASGKRTAEVNTCVLVDAQPHPVWIMRVLTHSSDDLVIGIDAETGKTVFTENYIVDETPYYVLYSMPETWKSLL